jgi:uncharacterized protein (TIGR03790 family)
MAFNCTGMIDPRSPKRPWLALALIGCLIQAAPGQTVTEWPTPADTVVLFNPSFPGSEALATYYAEQRGIPKQQLIGLKTPSGDAISRADFDALIRQPLRQAFIDRNWWTLTTAATGEAPLTTQVKTANKRVIAILRGIPFRIQPATAAAKPGEETEASVDSELTVLSLDAPPLAGFIKNPFFKDPLSFALFDQIPGLALVSRLDGPDDATVRRMIDDSLQAETAGLSGRAVIDLALKDGAYEQGEEWLRQTTKLYKERGIPTYVDRNADLIPEHWPLPETALYFGWYRDHVAGVLAQPSFRFAPGAVACHLHSFSAGQLRTPDKQWIAPLLQRGAAAALGNVWEPYLSLTTYFDFFNQRLLEGATLAEAAWAATPGLSWMTVVIGDPLYRPFKNPLTSRLTDGPARDYALFSGLVQRQAAGEPIAELKKTVLRLAEQRNNPKLIEFLALHAWQTGQSNEAIALFDHAADWYAAEADRSRVRLYQAEALNQIGNREAAKQALQSLPDDPAAKALLQLLQ